MNYDLTLMTKATQSVDRPLPPGVRAVREHIGAPVSRSIELRQAVSAWLYRLAERVAPRPARAECDALFEAVSTLLTEPNCDGSRLKSTSHGGCRCVVYP